MKKVIPGNASVSIYGKMCMSTPFSRAAADRLPIKLVQENVIITHIASFGKPMIVSTGMKNIIYNQSLSYASSFSKTFRSYNL